jgi:hypothetical protein
MATEQGWWNFTANVDLSQADLEHIAEMITQGFTEGQVAADPSEDDYTEFERDWFSRALPWCTTCKRPVIASEFAGYLHPNEQFPEGDGAEDQDHEPDTEEWWSRKRVQQIAGPLYPVRRTCDYTTGYGLPWTEKCGQPAVGKWHECDDEWFCSEHINPKGD